MRFANIVQFYYIACYLALYKQLAIFLTSNNIMNYCSFNFSQCKSIPKFNFRFSNSTLNIVHVYV